MTANIQSFELPSILDEEPLSSSSLLWVIIGFVTVYGIGAYSALYRPDWTAFLLSEMGPLETAGFVACALAFVGFAYALRLTLASEGFSLLCIYLLVLALGSLYLAGEEVSWGQWLFHFEPPASISAANTQREFNTHNLDFIDKYAHPVGLAALFGFFVILPLTAGCLPQLRRLLETYRVPVPPLQLTLLYVLAMFLFRAVLLALHARGMAKLNTGEMQEAFYEIIIFLFAVVMVQRTRRGSSAA